MPLKKPNIQIVYLEITTKKQASTFHHSVVDHVLESFIFQMNNLSFKLCSVCAEENLQKPKMGIYPCHGCQVSFRLTHLTKHRAELLEKLDSVIIQRDESIFKNVNMTNEHIEIALQAIDEWETKMHESVSILTVI